MTTRAKEILYAVKSLSIVELQELTPNAIKQHMGLSQKEWLNGYSKTFNAMRVGSNTSTKIGQKYRHVFEKVYHGCYYLTAYGEKLTGTLEEKTSYGVESANQNHSKT